MSDLRCPLHPRYKAVLPPRSKRPGCVCPAVYARRLQADAWDEGHRLCRCFIYFDLMSPCVNPYREQP